MMGGRHGERTSRPACGALRLLALLLAVALVAAACSSGGGPSGGTATPGGGLNGASKTPSGPVTVTLWHSMRSPLDGSLKRIIDAFNSSQSAYRLQAVYQGSYNDSLNKLINSIPSGDIPTLIQLDDVSTQLVADSGEVTPIQTFIDKEHFDLSDYEPKAIDYYRVGGKQYSMPFNLAGPILYYDKQDFSDAGLDPEKPPLTLDEVRQYAEKLIKRDAQGNVTRYGISLQVSPWFFEQMLAKQGALFVNNGNGRADRATDAVFAGPEGKRIIEWYRDMVKDGLAYYARDDTDALLSVAQDRASMTIGSTAVLGAAVALLAIAGEDPKRLGAGPLPAPQAAAGKEGGVALGGASFWILSRRPEAEQRGAWEFIKFATSTEQQAQWYADTGYFPVRKSAYGLPAALQRLQQFPQFKAAVDQLHASPDNQATQGALVGVFQQVRDRVSKAFQQVLGGGADADQELENAAANATKDMLDYNRTVK